MHQPPFDFIFPERSRHQSDAAKTKESENQNNKKDQKKDKSKETKNKDKQKSSYNKKTTNYKKHQTSPTQSLNGQNRPDPNEAEDEYYTTNSPKKIERYHFAPNVDLFPNVFFGRVLFKEHVFLPRNKNKSTLLVSFFVCLIFSYN
jgi:hypothetical protein